MIKSQMLEVLYDTDRDDSSVFIARSVQSHQLYQIPLIDALVGISDYLPNYPNLVVPCDYKVDSVVFRDIYFMRPDEVRLPDALVLNKDAMALFHESVGTMISNTDLITYICDLERLLRLTKQHRLMIAGVFVPPPLPPPIDAPIEAPTENN